MCAVVEPAPEPCVRLYLPEDFFSSSFNLTLKLDDNGRANLLHPNEAPQSAPQA